MLMEIILPLTVRIMCLLLVKQLELFGLLVRAEEIILSLSMTAKVRKGITQRLTSSGQDFGKDIVVGSDGFVYVAGYTDDVFNYNKLSQ